MIDLATLLTFTLAAFALAATPGPDMLLIMTRSVAQGRMAGFITLAGISLGCYFHAIIAGLSLSGVLLLAPVMFEIIRWAGAAYLLYLAMQAFRGAGGFQAPAAKDGMAPRIALGVLFRQGLLTNILNPKVALFFLALFPQFMQPDPDTAVAQALILASVLNVAGGLVNGGIIMAAGRLGEFLSSRPAFVRWQNRLLGGVFAALALRLAFDRR
ncbi:LysE family translocator [Ferrovibrio terrae]|uniref:LysE family translocator n=1 Tax=Ferrovibrio terrae TaxID=2594003 RepID=A0A516GZC1_9PROT|nr:LysE family translocator [Ferrovibrio terrae]QDO96690.1 LysE family translocator [Ferrovibrio terrae]